MGTSSPKSLQSQQDAAEGSQAAAFPTVQKPAPSLKQSNDALPCEWTRVGGSKNTLSRPLRGFELIINLLEEHNDGNCQLTAYIAMSSNLSTASTIARFDAAWYRTRLALPMLGVKLPSDALGTAVFEPFTSLADVQAWVEETALVIDDGRSLERVARDLKSEKMQSKDRLPRMHLVVRDGQIEGAAFQCSHVLSGHYILTVYDEFAKQMVRGECELGLTANVTSREEAEEVKRRLPVSTHWAYEQSVVRGKLPEPTAEELETLLRKQAVEAEKATSGRSIGLPVRSDWKDLTSSPREIQRVLRVEALPGIKKALKAKRLTLTTALFACIVAASAEASSPQVQKEADGVECLFSTHTGRWLHPDGVQGGGPITMGVIPASIWIDGQVATNGQLASSLPNLAASTPSSLHQLASTLQRNQNDALSSVHMMKRLDESSTQVFQSTQMGQRGLPAEIPGISKPTLTSQGEFVIGPRYESGETFINYDEAHYGGRHTAPSCCFAMNVFRGHLRVQCLFDERYFEQERVDKLMDRVLELFTDQLACGDKEARL